MTATDPGMTAIEQGRAERAAHKALGTVSRHPLVLLVAATLVAVLGWLAVGVSDLKAGLVGVETRLDRIEAAQAVQNEKLDRLSASAAETRALLLKLLEGRGG